MSETLEKLIHAAIDQWQIPGLSVAAVSPAGFYSASFGRADLENEVPATDNTVYRLASIAKPMTATAVLQLFERGKLDLDVPVQEYVPTFPQKIRQITPRLLLSHLSGIRDVTDAEMQSITHYPYHVTPMTTFLQGFQEDSLLHEPGAKFRYSTPGYNLLGAIIEAVSGTDYLQYMQENIFRPAGMTHTYPDDTHALIPHRARGYVREAGTLRNASFTDTSNHLAGGGFCGTAADVVRFGVAWQNGTLLRTETRQKMLIRQRTASGQDARFCLGWFTWTRNGETEVAHGGKHFGTSTMLTVRTSRGIAVAVLTNLESVSAPYLQSLTGKIADQLDKRA